ncbi:phosphatase PAP2 family protein [Photobacterium ganghwense]|uniref:undecaprenyl-diphosphate phosphatase n=1 Tax=Photobacterium ganghwense TaxID=320778 RepID=A0A0J1HHW7_9GAMM|nr:phosphatase PAP2 family protein [Photobacterium ganghwense]KLV11198.1 Type II phosphatidic acid phosphatase [Photobacterium ganghwense]PSU05176.1 phosphatase PAP2 family protein [Photobacterium ganghwense]QSV13797.1 phosphatase PAP2 family protein [Photobacterium ganghwense]
MTILTPLQRLDYAVSSRCLCHRFNVQVAQVSRAVSHTGDGHLYLLFALLVWLLDTVKGTEVVLIGLQAFALELPVYLLLKNSFKRARPVSLPSFIKPSDKYSLPSGHTAAAFVMASLITTYYPDTAWFIWPWAMAIGLSRVLLGVHYITDIAAGAALGLLCFQLVNM